MDKYVEVRDLGQCKVNWYRWGHLGVSPIDSSKESKFIDESEVTKWYFKIEEEGKNILDYSEEDLSSFFDSLRNKRQNVILRGRKSKKVKEAEKMKKELEVEKLKAENSYFLLPVFKETLLESINNKLKSLSN